MDVDDIKYFTPKLHEYSLFEPVFASVSTYKNNTNITDEHLLHQDVV